MEHCDETFFHETFDETFSWDILIMCFDETFWWDILMSNFDEQFWWAILMSIWIRHFDKQYWWDILIKHFEETFCLSLLTLITVDYRGWPLMTLDSYRWWLVITFDMVMMVMGWPYDSLTLSCLMECGVL